MALSLSELFVPLNTKLNGQRRLGLFVFPNLGNGGGGGKGELICFKVPGCYGKAIIDVIV